MNIRAIKESDKSFFAEYAREEDKAECLSVTNLPLEERIRVGVENSVESYAFVDERDNPCALFGVMRNKGASFCWLLTTILIEQHKKSYMKEVKRFVKEWYNKYGILFVIVDVRYERAIKLIEWCKFKRYGDSVYINSYEFRIYKYAGER